MKKVNPLLEDKQYAQLQEDKNNLSLQINKLSETNDSDTASKQKQPPKPSVAAYRKLLRYTLKHKFLLFAANFGLLMTSLGFVALPYLCGKIIDSISKDNNQSDLNWYCFQFVIVTLVAATFGFVRGAAYNLIGEKVVIELRNELFMKLLGKDIEFYDQNRSGELISRLTSDITVIQSAASDNISILLRNLIQLFGSVILLWLLTWQLTLILLSVVPPVSVLVIIFVKYYKRYSKLYQDLMAKSTQIATEALGNMRVVRSFSTEHQESLQYNKGTKETYLVGRKRAMLYGIFTFVGTILGYGVVLFVMWYGGRLVINGELSIGDLSSFVMYTMTLTVSLLSVSGTINVMVQASAVSEKIFELMDEEVKVVNGPLVINKFAKATFCYPTKPTVPVLNDIDLEIKSGEVVAFVGQSGSGKSTVVSLIERFYDVNEGQILVDGEDIKRYDIRALHKQIGFVSQEPTLFSGTLEENITYGVTEYVQEDIMKAMKLAHAYDFVQDKNIFPDGLKTIVGERGVKLSGGQKQRIAIARALIKNPQILIFDEATSALDSESEYQVQQAIDGLVESGQKTIIVIAHRLSTIINCNKIVVLQNGRIVETGTHQELLRQNGYYKQLIERQLSSFEEKEQEPL